MRILRDHLTNLPKFNPYNFSHISLICYLLLKITHFTATAYWCFIAQPATHAQKKRQNKMRAVQANYTNM